jgi:hypothetical protein
MTVHHVSARPQLAFKTPTISPRTAMQPRVMRRTRLLRHTVFVGLREDKPVEQVRCEA